MPTLKSARHHWWPECVSAHWAADDGKTGWIKPDGSCVRVPPKRLGVIGNAHHIKMGESGEPTDWDTSFESEFDKADSKFPATISWLQSLDRTFLPESPSRDRFRPQPATETQLQLLTECATSLAVRGPRNREASVALAEKFRGPLPETERNVLIGANMRNSQRVIADSIGARAKFAVLFSQGKEFIYGDGFFHNVLAVVNQPMSPKMLVPITPRISVVVARPLSFTVQPVLTTLVVTDAEVDRCNHAVQVYSRRALYFRSDKPELIEAFVQDKHLEYSDPDNPIDSLICSIPGVPPRDRSLDFLLRRARP
jgi:hypothetical protein